MDNGNTHEMRSLIIGMRAAYERGENAMAWARAHSTRVDNLLLSTLIAYDLQAGSYVTGTRANLSYSNKWCEQLSDLIRPYVEPGDFVLEAGVGEATTLAGVVSAVDCPDIKALGFDISWSRIKVAQDWVKEHCVEARLFVGDLFSVPLADNSIDVIYTSHSLEPNGGREEAAIRELLRVASKAVVLIEPIYELASEQAQERMSSHGYVQELKATAEKLGASVVEYGLLNVNNNPLNPSGVVLMVKSDLVDKKIKGRGELSWQCPLTSTPLADQKDVFYAPQVGIAYPVMRGIPLLRQEHGVVASAMRD